MVPENFKESSDPMADFTSSLIEISKECIPQTSTNPTKSNPWYNDDCKEAIKQRKQALSKFKRSPNTNNFNDIKVFRAKARRTIKVYMDHLFQLLRNLNSLAFYLIENSVLYPILNISKKCLKALNLLKVLSHMSWVQTELHFSSFIGL